MFCYSRTKPDLIRHEIASQLFVFAACVSGVCEPATSLIVPRAPILGFFQAFRPDASLFMPSSYAKWQHRWSQDRPL
jgi:hypothetical protein